MNPLEQNFLNVALTEEQARFVFETLTRAPLPFVQVAPVVDAFQRAGQQFQAKLQAQAEAQAATAGEGASAA